MQRPSNQELGVGDYFYEVERKSTIRQRLKKFGSSVVDWLARPASTVKINAIGSGYDADVDDRELMQFYADHPETHRTELLEFTSEERPESLSDRIRQASEEVRED